MAAVPGQAKPAPMTTERIQEMLEENFRFIKAIAEQQNLGRMQDVNHLPLRFQQKLQENLMLLAAVADTYASASSTGTAAPAATAPGTAVQAVRPQGPPITAPSQLPISGLSQQQPQQQTGQPNPLMLAMPGAAGTQTAAQPAAVHLTQQQIQAAVQQALARQQQQQQNQFQQQQTQQFQLPQTLQQTTQQHQQLLGQQQGLNVMGALGGALAVQGGTTGPSGASGFQLPAPPPLNLGL